MKSENRRWYRRSLESSMASVAQADETLTNAIRDMHELDPGETEELRVRLAEVRAGMSSIEILLNEAVARVVMPGAFGPLLVPWEGDE